MNGSSSQSISDASLPVDLNRRGGERRSRLYLKEKKEEYENIERLSDPPQDLLPEIPNPVGFLQELCVKKKLSPPIYGILSQHGPAHKPIFSTFCRVGEFNRVAKSYKKQKGKDMAAREMIICLRESLDLDSMGQPPKRDTILFVNTDTETSVESDANSESGSVNKTFTRTINYVGFLQELCVRKQLPPPMYGTEKCTGTPNNPNFYIFCEVGPHREVGVANNKKNAKHMAAEKVLGWLEMLPPSHNEATLGADNNENLQQALANERSLDTLSDTTSDNFFQIPNPIGHLQELCVKHRLTPPIYGIVKMEGPPHCPTFTTFCKVESFYQISSANNKKSGKEIAARKILRCLSERRSDANLQSEPVETHD